MSPAELDAYLDVLAKRGATAVVLKAEGFEVHATLMPPIPTPDPDLADRGWAGALDIAPPDFLRQPRGLDAPDPDDLLPRAPRNDL